MAEREGFVSDYKRHAEALLAVDESVGLILAQLEEMGVRDDTLPLAW
jgi:arylsulfatase A-like enzyme